MFMRTFIAASSMAVLSTAAYAGCGISSGSVRIAGSDFPAFKLYLAQPLRVMAVAFLLLSI